MRSWMHVLHATTACSPYGPFRTFDMGLSTSCQLFKSCPVHCLRLQLPEWLPGDLRHSEQLIPWQAPLPFVLRCQTRPTTLSTQQQLPTVPQESAKTHPRARLHRSDAIWDPMRMLRPHTHRPHPRFKFGKVLQSTSCSRYWPEGCRSQLTG